MLSQRAREKLKYYVYLYVDPRDQRVFYVGKGRGNRCLTHMNDKSESAKVKYIADLRKLGLKPRVEFLRYGLSEAEALLVEATAIELLGFDTLTNKVRGHGTNDARRGEVGEVAAQLDAREVEVIHPTLLINVNREYRFGMTVHELYDATRSAWRVNPERHKAAYAFSVYRGIVREVFAISGWVQGGTSMRVIDRDGRAIRRPGRWEFVGEVAEADVRKRYLGRSVQDYFPAGAQNPLRYVNC